MLYDNLEFTEDISNETFSFLFGGSCHLPKYCLAKYSNKKNQMVSNMLVSISLPRLPPPQHTHTSVHTRTCSHTQSPPPEVTSVHGLICMPCIYIHVCSYRNYILCLFCINVIIQYYCSMHFLLKNMS